MNDSTSDDGKDWRLQARLHGVQQHDSVLDDAADEVRQLHSARLDALVQRFRGPSFVKDVTAAVAPDVVITHDGDQLFAYAATQTALDTARAEIESALEHDGIGADVRLSHWDGQLDSWRQTDPPPSGLVAHVLEAQDRDGATVESQTLVANVGKMIRTEFEQSLKQWADQLGLQCEMVEHPHLLESQVAFHLSGPKHKIEEFRKGLAAEERQTLRAEREVMISAL